jgi:hypothetical protein
MNRELLWINHGPRSEKESDNRSVAGKTEFIHHANELYWRRRAPAMQPKQTITEDRIG